LSLVDPSGLDACVYDNGDGTSSVYIAEDGGSVGCSGDGFYITTSATSISGVSFDANGNLAGWYGSNSDGTFAGAIYGYGDSTSGNIDTSFYSISGYSVVGAVSGASGGGGNTGNKGTWLNALANTPWQLDWIFPLDPLPGILGVGPAGSITWNPTTNTLFVGVGAGASFGDDLSVGPVAVGTWNGQQATPSQIDQVLSGWSLNGGINAPTGPIPVGPGIRGSVNGSGYSYGPTVGIMGVSVSSTYAVSYTF
jgi:hypothetical protein